MSELRDHAWNICVVTSVSEELPRCGALANAILYGDGVLWLPSDLPLVFAAAAENSSAPSEMIDIANKFVVSGFQPLIKELKNVVATIDNFVIEIPNSLLRQPDEKLLSLFAASLPTSREENPLEQKLRLDMFKILHERATEMALGDSDEITDCMQRTVACIIDSKSPYSKPYHLNFLANWDADQAAQVLMSELSSVLFPDVAKLSIPEVAEFREKLRDNLDPVRGELLRLSVDLRELIKDEPSVENLCKEAKNIIKVRVKPVVLEANKHAEEIMRKRWKKLFHGAFKFIGLASLGFVAPTFCEHAMKHGIDVATQALHFADKPKPSTASAHFTLEVRQILKQHAAN